MIKILDLNYIEYSIDTYFPNLNNKDKIITLLSSNLDEDLNLAIEIIKLSQDFMNEDTIHLIPKNNYGLLWFNAGFISDPIRIVNIIRTPI